MSDQTFGTRDDDIVGAGALPGQAAAAETRARRFARAAADAISVIEADRLDERTRFAAQAMLADMVAALVHELRARSGSTSENGELTAERVIARLRDAGVLRDPAIAVELAARAAVEQLSRNLPIAAVEAHRPTLAERFGPGEDDRADSDGDTAAALHATLAWSVAAVLEAEIDAATLARAVTALLADMNSGKGEDAVAADAGTRLPDDSDMLPQLLAQAIDERRLSLFIALLSQALRISVSDTRLLVLDHGGESLWLALRAVDAPRTVIARIGFALSEADPRYDIERLADSLDAVMAVTPDQARAALMPLSLPAPFRVARRRMVHSA